MKAHVQALTYADFKVGDVFVGNWVDNYDLFSLVALRDRWYDVLNLRSGLLHWHYLSLDYAVPSGYSVYRGGELVRET